jgi:hypothetical protein
MEEVEIKSLLDKLADFKAQFDVMRLDYDRLRDETIPPEVKTKLNELDVEFADKHAGIARNIASLEEEIKKDVLDFGTSVKGTSLHAVFAKGRVTWDGKTLDKFVNQYPEIGVARNEGEPSVSLRFIK